MQPVKREELDIIRDILKKYHEVGKSKDPQTRKKFSDELTQYSENGVLPKELVVRLQEDLRYVQHVAKNAPLSSAPAPQGEDD